MPYRVQHIIPLRLVRLQKGQIDLVRIGQVLFVAIFLFFFQRKAQAQIPTNTTLTSSPTATCFNQPVTFTATVDQSAAAGNVNFWRDGFFLGAGGLNGSGIAAITISDLPAGTHSIIAVYEGVIPFDGSISDTLFYTVNAAPVISSQPSNHAAFAGCSPTFAVTVDGTGPFTYQWRKNDADISNANAETFTLNNIRASDAGNYSVIVTNSCGSVTSNNATLTVSTRPSASITYGIHQWCSSVSTPQTVTRTGAAGGIYQAFPSELDIDPFTGTIIPSNSVPGTYIVMYTIGAGSGCPVIATRWITILTSPTVFINADFCGNGGSVRLTADVISPDPVTYVWSTGATSSDILADRTDTYSVTATNSQGCSATSSLDVTVNPNATSTQNISICENALPYNWNSQSLTAAGIYTALLQNINGCDSTVTLNLVVNTNVSNSEDITICQNALPYGWNNQSITTAGIYTALLQNINGCDSTVTLNLVVNTNVSNSEDITICHNALPYSWNNQSLTAAGTYSALLQNINGCDSTVTLYLTVNPDVSSTQNITICQDALPYSWNNQSLTGAGTYTVVLQNVNGCDSTVTLNLTINPTFTSTQNITICQDALPYSWNNQSLTVAGTYSAVFQNINGCDSTVILNLTINPSVTTTQNITICQNALPYSWNNQSLTAAGTYTTLLQTINGCDSTLTLYLTVNPDVSSTQNISICQDAMPYSWNNQSLTVAGTYSAVFQNINGCDSTVMLNLTINPSVTSTQNITICQNALPYSWNNQSLTAAGTYTTLLQTINGCDSTVTLHLTINPDVSSTQNISICQNALPYSWNNQSLTGAGTYTVVLQNVNGCDSTVTLNLTINPTFASTQNITICQNALPYSWNNQSLTGAGTYTVVLQNVNGCDSTVTLNLTINPTVASTQNITICQNALPYSWNNQSLTVSGTYSAVFQNINGCDSTVTLNLTINPNITSTQSITICQDALPYSWNNQSLTGAGTYTVVLQNVNGCDSTVTLNLTINPTVASTQNITICQDALPYSWNNQSLTGAGTYIVVLQNVNGCDSAVTLHLTVNSNSSSTENVTICEAQLPFSWNGYTLTSAGTATALLQNINGCDSIVTLNLSVNPIVTGSETITICEGQLPFTWNGQTLSAAGTVTVTLQNVVGCDSISTLHLIVNPNVTSTQNITICQNALPYLWNNQSLNAGGTYTAVLQNIHGCDSTVTLNLTINPNVTSTQTIAICQNALPYSWNNQSLTVAGTYTAVLRNINGCDSTVTLRLTVNPKVTSTQNIKICQNSLPYLWNNQSITGAGTYTALLQNVNGCDSTVTLNLVVNSNVTSTQNITICQNALPYSWSNQSLTTAGTFTAVLQNVNGCDSTVTLNLVVNPNVSSTQNITICQNALPYSWSNQSLTTVGTFTAVLQNINGCDSTVTLHLTVNPNVTSIQNVTVCQNALPYKWNSQSLNAAGTYTAQLQNNNGCDSTVTLHLTVNPNVSSTQNITICQNSRPYSWNNQSLTAAGTYTAVLQNITGCDSTVTLRLVVNPNVSSTQNITICQNALPYSWNNQSLTAAGIYTAVLQNINGCDSTVTLRLNVNSNVSSTENVIICEAQLPFTWNGQRLTTAGTATALLQNINGCDSIVTLNLSVNPIIMGSETVTICEGQLPFTWNSHTLSAAGAVTVTLQNVVGCDSIATLHLIVNPNVTSTQSITICQDALPYSWNNQSLTGAGTYTVVLQNVNGCDSTVTLNLTINPTVASTQNISICQDAMPYNWNNQSLTGAGTYTVVLQNVNGCDSTVTLNLTINPTVTSTQNITICQDALPYSWNNQSLTGVGTYTVVLQNVHGCDSAVTLHLTVNSNSSSTENVTICEAQLPFSWNGHTLTSAGTATALLQNINGCDSIVTLNLSVNPIVTGSETITICEGQLPFTWNGQTLSAAGTVTVTLQNVVGCDSIATLHLIVNPNVTSTQNITICQNALPYLWNNQSLNAGGTYTAVLQNIHGCDSTVTLNLTINPNVTSTQNIAICQNALPYSWNNQSLTGAGTYTVVLQNVNGCDSTVTLNLTINPTVASTQNITICQNALPYSWNNQSLTGAGTYTVVLRSITGCDSTVTLRLIVKPDVSSTQNITICQNSLPYSWNNQSLTAAGTYTAVLQNINGCDSTVTLHLTVNPNVASTQNITICQNALPYSWNNQSLTAAGTYSAGLRNINGCDSTVTMHLTVNPNVSSTQSITICQNALPYNWNSQSLTAAGTYTAVLQNINGCDSTVTLHLTVNPNVTSIQNVTICQNALPYNWNNQSLTAPGIYTAVLQNINGCDSTVTLHLTVNPNVTSIQNVTICQNALPYNWNNQSLTAPGIYTAVLQNINGCDSTVTLHLTVNPNVSTTKNITICQNALPYNWNSQSLNAAGTYTAVLQNINGCDSTVTLHLTVNPNVSTTKNITICQNAIPYNWNNQSLTAAGTYTAVLQNINGCDSTVTLHLTVNPNVTSIQNVTICQNALPYNWNNQSLTAPGIYTAVLQNINGCDSTVTLHLTVNPNVSTTKNITICQNALPYNWNSQSLNAAGTYTAVLQNINGCDSTVILHLTVNPNVTSIQNVTICQNALSYSWNNQSLTAAGTYTAVLRNINGCDSTVILHVTVNPNVTSIQNVTICQNALPYSWNNQSLTAAGTYTAVLRNINGCDSTVTLHLTVNPNVTSIQNVTICQNALPYSWNNQSLTAAGTYTPVLRNINGCDSTVTLHLTVNPTVTSIQNVTICQNALPYNWNNQSLTAPGIYTAVLQNINGCDSTVTLHLTVNPNVSSTQSITICQNALPYNWNSQSLTAAGTYTAVLQNINGCDSTVTLHLTVNPNVTSIQNVTICQNALPYNWNNQSLTAPGIYTAVLQNINGCDSTVTLHLTVNPNVSTTKNITICQNALPYNWNSQSLNAAGTYTAVLQNINGCDSTVILHVTVNPNVTSIQNVTICQNALPYNWNNQSLNAGGTYTAVLQNIHGCDSTVTLRLIVNPNVSSTQNITICQNALPYSWNNQSLNAGGTYTTLLQNVNGCDSTVTLHLTVNPNVASTQNITICQNALPYSWNNQSLTAAGTYSAGLRNINGCDSTVTMHLTVNPNVSSTQSITICQNALPYNWNSQSLTAAGTYTAVLQNINGCDSTVTLHLTVNPNVTSIQNVTICQNALPYNWNNQSLTAPGIYTAVLQNINGCDSTVTLHLTVNPNVSTTKNITICQNALPYNWNSQSLNAAGTYTAVLRNINGCDSTVTLHLTVNPNVSSTQSITICQNALPYNWNSQSLTAAGTYTAVLQNINGCDSTVTLHLTVNPNVTSIQNVTICQNALPYNWNNQSLTAPGIYTAVLQNINGCDSTVILHLTVNPNVTSIQNVTICQNALSYSWNNQSLNAAGTYTAVLQNINGCDSTVTLHLTVNPNVTSIQNVTICQNALPYNWNNQSLTAPGIYTAVLQNINGCDSTVILHLTVNPNVTSIQNVTICQNAIPYNWNNQSLTAAGTYTAVLQNINGCDSTVTLHLTVNPNVSSTQSITICQNALPYNWNNQSLTAPGIYTAVLQNINGCDSTVTLHLTVNPNVSTTKNITICQNALPYNWNSQSLNAAGTYTAVLRNINGCDSTVTMHLTVNPNVSSTQSITICQNALPYNWNSQSLTAAGTYTAVLQNINGCDSVVTLTLNVNPNVKSVETITVCEGALPYNWSNQSLTTAGTYSAILQNINGCDSSTTLHLIVNPIVNGEETIIICASVLPYNWNNQTITAAGDYTATLVSAAGCDSIVTLHLIVGSQPKIVTSPVSSCTTANLTDASVIAGSDQGLVLSYWLDAAATNAIPDPASVLAGTYYIKGINSSGCYSIETVTVTIEPAPLFVFIVTNPAGVCEPATADLTADYITAGSDPRLTFTYWMDAAAAIPLVNPQAVGVGGTYYIKATAVSGCDFVKLKEVSVVAVGGEKSVRYPTVTVSPNESVQLTAREPGLVNNYTWYPAVGLNSYNRKDPTFRYDQNTEYTVRIESGNGCPVVDTIMVVLRSGTQTCVSDIFVPKAWSPNNDSHNDRLYPLAVCIKELIYFRVFNRWGQLVFETNIPGQGWDGIFHGQPQVMDTYSWRLESIGKDGKYFKREGNAVLIR